MTVETSTWTTKKGLAQMLKGGVSMDVATPDQARIAEVSRELGSPMRDLAYASVPLEERLAVRGG